MPRKSRADIPPETPQSAGAPKGALRQLRLLPLRLIDPPEVAMRVEIDDDFIAGLAASIRDTGLMNPVCLFAQGARYRIASGHCRYLACKLLGKAEIESWDYTRTGMSTEQIKAHENLWRRDPNDGEIIQYLDEIQQKRSLTMDELRQMTGQSEHWINTRMAIVRGDTDVRLALTQGKISLAQATVLNKFPDEYRHTYLQNVVESTPPARLVESWLRDIRLMLSHQAPGAAVPPPVPVEAMPGLAPVEACTLCGEAHSPWTYKTYTAHEGCMKSVVQQLRGGGS